MAEERQPPILCVRLLGNFCLTYEGKPVTGVTSDRLRALLAALLLHQDTPQPRQQLAFQFWADATEAQARTNLRKALHQLRYTLPHADRFLSVDAKTLQWRSESSFCLDVAEFEAALVEAEKARQAGDWQTAQTAWEAANHWYRGELLQGLDEDWILPERERLHQQWMKGLEALIDLLESQQQYRAAILHAQQLLNHDPLQEATYCTLMRLHDLNGDRASALKLYHQCMTALREELGIDPGATIRHLYEQILNQDGSSPEVAAESLTRDSTEIISLDSSLINQFPKLISNHSSILPETQAVYRSPNYIETHTKNHTETHTKNNTENVSASQQPSLGKLSFPIAPPQLIGRQQEWQTIQAWLQNAEQGQSPMLLVVGEPGIGKTRLMEELQAAIQAQAGVVLWGRAFEAEMVRAYGIWVDALRSIDLARTDSDQPISLPIDLASLLPELQGTEPPSLADRSRLFDAVVQYLSQWASHRFLLVILDDIQWLDEASTALLHYAVRLLHRSSVRFACTARQAEWQENLPIAKLIQAMRRERKLKTLEVMPLTSPQVAELVQWSAIDPQTHLNIDRIFADSGGNPLFALEIARALSQDHSPQDSQSPQDPITPNLDSLIADRLSRLDQSARDLMIWAAAMGRSFDPATVAQIAHCPLPQLLNAIDHLERQSIIRPTAAQTGLNYDFSHDIVRQVAYQQLSPPRRRLIHLQIAHALQTLDREANPGDIAHHAALGGDDSLAVRAFLEAAQRCLRLFAYTEAASLTQRGLQHCQALPEDDRISFALQLLQVYILAGVRREQIPTLQTDLLHWLTAAQNRQLTDAITLGLQNLILLNYEHGNFSSVRHHSLQVAELSRTADPLTTARNLAYSGSCLAEIEQEMERAEALLLEAQSLAARVGEEILDGLIGLGYIRLHQGESVEAKALFQRGWQLAQAEQDHWRECSALIYLAMAELETHQPQVALSYCRELARVAAQMGEGSEAPFASALEALAQYQIWQEAPALTAALDTLRQIDANRMLAYILTHAAEVDLHHQATERAIVRAEEALVAAHKVNYASEVALAWTVWIRAQFAAGQSRIAVESWQQLQQQCDRSIVSHRAKTAMDQLAVQVSSWLATLP